MQRKPRMPIEPMPTLTEERDPEEDKQLEQAHFLEEKKHITEVNKISGINFKAEVNQFLKALHQRSKMFDQRTRPAQDDPRIKILEILEKEQARLMNNKKHPIEFQTLENGTVERAFIPGNRASLTKAEAIAIDRVKAIYRMNVQLQKSLSLHPLGDDKLTSEVIYQKLSVLRDQMKSTTGKSKIFVTGRNNITLAMECVKPPKLDFVQRAKNALRR